MFRTLTIVEKDGRRQHWNLGFSDQGTLQVRASGEDADPPWTRLEYHQCPACTLDSAACPSCPVAEILSRYARDLADRASFERVKVIIIGEDGRRITLEDIALQTVVGELVRLAVYQSGCPVGRRIKPVMVRLNPFPSNRQILDAFAMYFALHRERDDGQAREDYLGSLHDVFGCLAERLEKVGEGDVYPNAVVIVHSLSVLFSLSAPELIKEAAERLALE